MVPPAIIVLAISSARFAAFSNSVGKWLAICLPNSLIEVKGWEEINFETYGNKGGINYGWNIFEGNHCYPEDSSCINDGYMMPIFEYPNNANYARTLLGFKQKANMDGC